MTTGAYVLLATLVVATAFGLYRASRDGRFRGTHAVRGAGTARRSGLDTSDRPPADQAPGPVTGRLDQPPADQPRALDIDHELGERATLLQFSSAFCAPCRATRRVLGDVAGVVPGVVHVEIDAEHHLDLVRRLGIMRTPTTLVLDEHGREVSRATGLPRKESVLGSLAQVLDRQPGAAS